VQDTVPFSAVDAAVEDVGRAAAEEQGDSVWRSVNSQCGDGRGGGGTRRRRAWSRRRTWSRGRRRTWRHAEKRESGFTQRIPASTHPRAYTG
jgi:hypothetical protein